MKTIKFKNPKFKKNTRIVILFLVTIFFIILLYKNISDYISFDLEEYVSEKVKKENVIILKKAFNKTSSESDIDNYINVLKNSKDEIVEVEFNIKECTKILNEITGYMNEDLHEYNYIGYRIDIPLGYKMKNPLVMNLTPKIPIKVELTDIALGNAKTKVQAFGINSALIEVYLEVYLDTSILYPFETSTIDTSYTWLLSSKIISGKVPDFYNGTITNESPTFASSIN